MGIISSGAKNSNFGHLSIFLGFEKRNFILEVSFDFHRFSGTNGHDG